MAVDANRSQDTQERVGPKGWGLGRAEGQAPPRTGTGTGTARRQPGRPLCAVSGYSGAGNVAKETRSLVPRARARPTSIVLGSRMSGTWEREWVEGRARSSLLDGLTSVRQVRRL